MTRTVQARAQAAVARFVPETLNVKERTVELVWSTGEAVLRVPWFGDPFLEELDLGEGLNLRRLNSGAPLLNCHRKGDLSDILGVVERAWVVGNEARALVRFSEREDVEPFFRDVASGIIRNVSCGYTVARYLDVTRVDDKIKRRRATDWTPFELTLLPVGADTSAGTRGAYTDDRVPTYTRDATLEHTLTIEGSDAMPQPTTRTEPETQATDATRAQPTAPTGQPTAQPTAPATPAAEPVTRAQPASPPVAPTPVARTPEADLAAERQRVQEIGTLLTRAHVTGADYSRRLGEYQLGGHSVEQVRNLILEERAFAPSNTPIGSHVQVLREEGDAITRGIEGALLIRAGYTDAAFKPGENENRFRHFKAQRLAEEFLRSHGVSTVGRSPEELFRVIVQSSMTRAFDGTADFSAILANVMNKTGLKRYQAVPRTFLPWARRIDANDFRMEKLVQLSGGSALKKKNEHGEFEHSHMTDRGEDAQLGTYGRIMGLTREAFVNDDLGYLTRWSEMALARAADKESDIVYAILTGNAVMSSDNVALFHATHNNLVTSAGDLTNAGLQTIYSKLLAQKDADSNPISLTPGFLLIPTERFVAAAQILGATNPSSSAGINPFQGMLKTIVEVRLSVASAVAFYMIADPNTVDTVIYGYLNGQEGPVIESANDIKFDGLYYRIRHDFRATAVEWVSMVKSNGV